MNCHREKFQIFKSGTKLEAKFTNATNRIVELEKEQPKISAGGEAMVKSLHS